VDQRLQGLLSIGPQLELHLAKPLPQQGLGGKRRNRKIAREGRETNEGFVEAAILVLEEPQEEEGPSDVVRRGPLYQRLQPGLRFRIALEALRLGQLLGRRQLDAFVVREQALVMLLRVVTLTSQVVQAAAQVAGVGAEDRVRVRRQLVQRLD